MKEYVLVSQGIEIYRTTDKDEAIKCMEEENEAWFDYKQKCLDDNEPYADNEIFLYEED